MLFEALHGRGELETPMELFWLNLVTDTMPALGLALAEPRGDVMARAPRSVDAPLFSRAELAGIGFDGLAIGAAALTAHLIAMAKQGVGPSTRSATFLTLALGQIAHAWALRDRSAGGGEALVLSERRLEAMLGAATALLALPFLAPGLRRLLGLGPTPLSSYLLSGALAAASFGVAEGRRIIVSASETAGSSQASPPVQTA